MFLAVPQAINIQKENCVCLFAFVLYTKNYSIRTVRRFYNSSFADRNYFAGDILRPGEVLIVFLN